MIILNCISIIILLVFEIIFTAFAVLKLKKVQAKIEKLNSKLLFARQVIASASLKIQKNITGINKFISILTNKKLKKIGIVLKFLINGIQIFVFLRTFGLSKGLKGLNFKNIRKIIYIQIAKNIISKALTRLCR